MLKRIVFRIVCLCIMGFASIGIAKAQGDNFTVEYVTSQNIKTVLEQYFLGEGVKIDTTKPIYYNGKTVIDNNQIGIFTNKDTSATGRNLPLASGLILATDAAKNIGGGYDMIQNPTNGTSKFAPFLYLSYKEYCESDLNIYGCQYNDMPDGQKYRDLAVLDFYVIPQSCEMSFRYCFGSSEYPNFVGTSFNDIFGLYCGGPFDENDVPIMDDGNFFPTTTNIAVIPGTYDPEEGITAFTDGTAVMVNTVNNGNLLGGISQNPEYFIDNRDRICTTTILGGYTKRLETAVLPTTPYKRYHIRICICNINDDMLQSAVFLEANSFIAKTATLSHNQTKNDNYTDGVEITKDANGKIHEVYMKGCATDTLIVKLNYDAGQDNQDFEFSTSASNGSDLVRGLDYEYYKIVNGEREDVPTGDKVVWSEGDREARLLLQFLHNPNKTPGTIDTLYFVSKDCAGNPEDTIMYVMQEPLPLSCDVQGGKTLCHNVLPSGDTIRLAIDNYVAYAQVVATRGGQEIYNDIVRPNPDNPNQTINVDIRVTMNDVNDTEPVVININDHCRQLDPITINYAVISSFAEANADKTYLCEGDSTRLSCNETAQYLWTSFPTDTTLRASTNAKTQNPVVCPQKTTTYYITTISEEGCIAKDSVKVSVEKIIKAEMEVKPKQVYYSNPQISYMDLSDNAFALEWSFGDGTTSSLSQGFHQYPVDTSEESHTYEVMLIVYNQINCPDTIRDSVRVVADFTIWIPNAFSPESDIEENRVFAPKVVLLKDWELFIFNRWGTKVYQGKNKGWDGTLANGTMAPQGTYVYSVLYKDGHGMPQRKSGTVNLLPDEKQ